MPKLATPSVIEYAPALEVEAYGLQSLGPMIAYPSDQVLRDKCDYNLAAYRDLHREPSVKSAFQQRRAAIIACERQVVPGDEKNPASVAAAEQLQENLNLLDMDGIMKDMLFGVMMGYAVGQIVWAPIGPGGQWWIADIKRHRQEYFRFDFDGNLYQITRTHPDGEPWPQEKAWVFRCHEGTTDDPYGLGLGHFLFWSVFFRRNAHRFWQVYLEKFAAPTAMAEAPPNVTDSPTERQKVLQMLQALRRDSGVIVPTNIKVSLLEATRSGTVDYAKMIEVADLEITTCILSQTLTTAAAGGQYKAEVQERVKDDVVKEDADLLCSSFNTGPARWWTNFNFGPDVPAPKLWINTENPPDLKTMVQVDKEVAAMGFELSEEAVRERYGDGWTKKAAPEPIPGLNGAAPPTPGLPSFADLGMMADAIGGADADQVRIKEAAIELARKFPEQWQEFAELRAALQESGDFATFAKRLRDMAGRNPPPDQIQQIERQGIIARLLGIRRQQQ